MQSFTSSQVFAEMSRFHTTMFLFPPLLVIFIFPFSPSTPLFRRTLLVCLYHLQYLISRLFASSFLFESYTAYLCLHRSLSHQLTIIFCCYRLNHPSSIYFHTVVRFSFHKYLFSFFVTIASYEFYRLNLDAV